MENFIIAQSFGILGMGMNAVSYQAKTQKNIILFQMFGSLFFAINMYMLGAWMGCMLNAIGIFRALIYANKEKLGHLKFWSGLFFLLYIISYAATFIVFKKEFTLANILVEMLPLIAMIATTIGFAMKDAKSVRYSAFVSSPSWLLYNCINLSIGGILCESFSLVSVVTALFRHDFRGAKTK